MPLTATIGTAINNAIEDLVPVIADAPATKDVRQNWLERLYQAHQDDAMPYIERLGDY